MADHSGIAEIESQQAEMEETLVQWANINSGSENAEGVAQMADEIEAFVAPLSAKVERTTLAAIQRVSNSGQLVSLQTGPLLTISTRESAEQRILLCGHLDTVFPKDSSFQTCQSIANNQLNGPGVSDMKGGILAMLTALKAFEQREDASKIGWTVMLVPDEEIGSLASREYLQEAAKTHYAGLVYEPSITPDGVLAGQRKGSGNFHFVIHGTPAHAGRAFDDGNNAIVAASQLAIALHALNAQRPGVTINVGGFHGGEALNQVPGKAVLRVNVRTQMPEDETWFEDACSACVAQCIMNTQTNIDVHGGFTRPPRLLEGDTEKLFHHVRTVASAIGQEIEWQATGGVCDGNNLCASGLPTVDTLGVRGGLIHTDQEFICLESLSERAALSYALLVSFAGGAYVR